MTAILTAIGRGFTSNRILNSLSRRFPQIANTLAVAQAAGYTSSQILRKIYNKSTGKELSEDHFMTSNQRLNKELDKHKRDRAFAVIGALGTAGALAAGGYALASRNKAIQPSQILPSQNISQRMNKGQGQIINTPNRTLQIGNQGPTQPNSPTPTNPKSPVSPIINSVNPNRSPLNKAALAQKASLLQRSPTENIALVNNFKQEQRFQNMIRQGFEPEVTSELLKITIPKDIVKVMEKQPGGLQGIVEDYTEFLNQNPKQEPESEIQEPEIQQEQSLQKQQTQQSPMLMPQQQISPQVLNIDQSQTPAGPLATNPVPFNEARQEVQPIRPEAQITPIKENAKYEPETQGNLALLPKGEIGSVESVKNGVAKVNINGKVLDKKLSDLSYEPPGTEQAVRHILSSIPENMKSTSLSSMVHLPQDNILLVQFHDGKWAWYKDFPEDTYRNIALGIYDPKGQGKTGIGEYKPGVADSRGAGFHKEIRENPKYSKGNKGSTWGYASNEYSLLHDVQKTIHKISKEKLDEKGNIIEKKPRKKST